MPPPNLRIGTAGWTLPRAVADGFPEEGSSLARYAARFDAAEINTTFYRPHQSQTYARWAEATPDGFRFAVKMPKAITHDARLTDCGEALQAFVAQAQQLAGKLGPLLVQLPPSLAFDAAAAGRFFGQLRDRFTGLVACEPRHVSWFEPAADALLRDLRIARVAADPARHPLAYTPGGWGELAYWRLHGSPRMYFSSYDEAALRTLAGGLISGPAAETWCIFDNTASGAAAADALRLREFIEA